MDLRLVRVKRSAFGIFSQLAGGDTFRLVSIEHSYPDDEGAPVAKIPDGTYTCRRGKHRLHGMTEDFETFEITGVPGHQGLLFHWGNFNRDSEGCVCVGKNFAKDMLSVEHSRDAFKEFMDAQAGLDEFQLTVSG